MRGFLRRLLRPPRRAGGGTLTLFAYHGIVERPLDVPDPCFMRREVFVRQVEAIAAAYEVVPLEEGLRGLAPGAEAPPRAALTFDDGYEDFARAAYPVLRERNLPATVFLSTAFLGGDGATWHGRLHHGLTKTERSSLSWGGRSYTLRSTDSRARASIDLQSALKVLPGPELEKRVDEILAELGVEGAGAAAPGSPFRILRREEVGRIAGEGLVRFGAHGHRHWILSRLTGEEKAREIVESVRAVGEAAGVPPLHFAYPNGGEGDYDTGTIELLRERGIRAAATMKRGRCRSGTPLFELPRAWVDEGTDLREIGP